MSQCGCGHSSGGGPFSEGCELVEFVYNAHGGGLRDAAIQTGAIETVCQGCGAAFTLATFVGKCPQCQGVHAIAPPRSSDPKAIQFAGIGYTLPE